ncbi:hypothetical protein CRV24_007836 [Beauveria bassiana]|uniref:Uncharacterized protein n=1 Tax=Beauveria bassiana (strain ARSEF 2860) TaxID=655819 RepID=J4UVB9_BEAB2|nr:uncharacterized protein BBA_00946 [Beauveria bassiana ARSEF 2860]EJP70077.1 hypothetical protein BBA_00946 [Beauveria bassiana ARSEF 2860]KAF1731649.1 hypothetical protein CRV24_007836 [Beauveria bassiana]KAH8715878.1 hypothetical protein HC256_004669 [Beauveria bassiana]
MATTPTGAPARRHARQDSNGSIPPLRPQASSPTLTNPDMILPDYDESQYSSLQHPSVGWGSMPLDADLMFDFPEAVDSSAVYPLNTPIIYGNGTMLSDIGEVTEVESNVGGPTRQLSARSNRSRRSNHSDDNLTPRTSPPANAARKQTLRRAPDANAQDNRSSIDSVHTISTHHDVAFADFDDTISVGDSNFQGDDEDSVASSYLDEHTLPRDALARKSGLSLNKDRYSTSSISRRAEQILANAKRRLTTMEGNLSRARTLSYSSVSDGSTPSPIRTPNSPAFRVPVHARNISDNNIATPDQNAMPPRSASALGAAGGYRRPLPLSRSADAITRANHGISQHPLDLALEPLREDDGAQDEDSSDSTQVARYASPTFNGYGDGGIVRSASAAQMRGIQDQMNGLKGKIYSLREQAAADSMKRRSLQSLRSPSLFTNARVDVQDSDYQAAQAQGPESPSLGSPFRPEFAKEDDKSPPAPDEQSTPPGKRADRDLVVARSSPMQNLHQAYLQDENTPPKTKAAAAKQKFDKLEQSGYADDNDDLHTENGDAEESAEDSTMEPAEERAVEDLAADTASESGDSLYHEAYQHPVSHEDREDAFDYEHFFLHSAMGHVSRQSYRNPSDDSGSECSEDSVETTRAAPTTAFGRPRRPSLDTMTSVDSFATAREGADSRASTVDTLEDGYESPIIGIGQLRSQTNKRSSSEDSRSSKEQHSHRNAFQYRPATMAPAAVCYSQRLGLHRPSVSSFESIGTNRSFPLINKSRLSGNTTPRDSPENMIHGMRSPPQSRRSSMNEHVLATMSNLSSAGSANGSFNGSANGSVADSVSGPSSGSVGSVGSANGSTRGLAHGYSGSTNGGTVNGSHAVAPPSPTMQPLTGEDQASIDLLLASIQKCAMGLRDTTPSGFKMHDTYRRRLEAARQILDGAPDSF